MAISGSIKVIVNGNKEQISAFDLIEIFFLNQWHLSIQDKIYYLPVGDVDYNWKIVSATQKSYVEEILKLKSHNNEPIGVALSLKDTERGITILFSEDLKELNIDLDINRKTISGLDVSDFSWYLKKIIPIIIDSGLSIGLIECTDG
jgi:hypothetical protein